MAIYRVYAENEDGTKGDAPFIVADSEEAAREAYEKFDTGFEITAVQLFEPSS